VSSEVDFLTSEDVLAIHVHQIQVYGGSSGVRDMGLLLSAVEMPKASFGGTYLHQDLYSMAAAYLFHIVQGHPFVDGNKRVGLAAAIAFLALHNIHLVVDHDTLTEIVLNVAQGKLGKREIADFLSNHTESASS
jgi:death on curing protein